MAELNSNTNNVEATLAATETKAEGTATAAEPEKTFTQAEVDTLVSERIARERKNLPSDVDLKAFREWKKSQQTEAEKAAEREAELTRVKAELAVLTNQQAVSKAECRPEFVEFVADRVSRMEGDFEKNLTAYKKQNPQYFGTSQIIKQSSSPNLSGGSGAATTNDIMNNLIRNARRN